MEVVVQQEVGRLEIEMKQRRTHAVQEIHPHGDIMNHLELLGPHERVAGQEMVQGPITHVFHHHRRWVAAQPIDGNDIFDFHFCYLGGLLCHSSVGGWRERAGEIKSKVREDGLEVV